LLIPAWIPPKNRVFRWLYRGKKVGRPTRGATRPGHRGAPGRGFRRPCADRQRAERLVEHLRQHHGRSSAPGGLQLACQAPARDRAARVRATAAVSCAAPRPTQQRQGPPRISEIRPRAPRPRPQPPASRQPPPAARLQREAVAPAPAGRRRAERGHPLQPRPDLRRGLVQRVPAMAAFSSAPTTWELAGQQQVSRPSVPRRPERSSSRPRPRAGRPRWPVGRRRALRLAGRAWQQQDKQAIDRTNGL